MAEQTSEDFVPADPAQSIDAPPSFVVNDRRGQHHAPAALPNDVLATPAVVPDLPPEDFTGRGGRERLMAIIKRELPQHTIGLPNVEFDVSLIPLPQPNGQIMPGWLVLITCKSTIIGETDFSTVVLAHPRPNARVVGQALEQIGKALAESRKLRLVEPPPSNGSAQ